jgi:hypothetical protein
MMKIHGADVWELDAYAAKLRKGAAEFTGKDK